MFETKKRTFARMISYRITAFVMTVFWTYLFTGDIGKSTIFSGLLHLLLSLDYYVHERAWLRVRWGLVQALPPASDAEASASK